MDISLQTASWLQSCSPFFFGGAAPKTLQALGIVLFYLVLLTHFTLAFSCTCVVCVASGTRGPRSTVVQVCFVLPQDFVMEK